jgi:N-acetyl-anhydromuramyl-L-alanine amidase AmpD
VKRYIVIHHSATPDGTVHRDFDSLRRGHLSRGFRDIGYHWVIEYVDGVLAAIPGRAEWESGAHCIGRNVDGIGVCVIGNFEYEYPSEELYQFVAQLCRQIMTRYPIIEIGGHRDYDATLCPGKHFDVEKVWQIVKEGEALRDVKVIVKGKEILGKLIDGQTYVPLRPVIEAMNYAVVWQGPDKPVIVE